VVECAAPRLLGARGIRLDAILLLAAIAAVLGSLYDLSERAVVLPLGAGC
jgi:hypothetical protein